MFQGHNDTANSKDWGNWPKAKKLRLWFSSVLLRRPVHMHAFITRRSCQAHTHTYPKKYSLALPLAREPLNDQETPVCKE